MVSRAVPLRVLIRKFKALDYRGPYSGGRHSFMIKGSQKIRIPNPHGSKEIDVSLVKEILRQASIKQDEWDSV